MLTNVVRVACALTLLAFFAVLGSLAWDAHCRGRARLRRHRVRRLELDGYAEWLAAMDRRRAEGRVR